ncbi:MAG TPA: nuclear transport factor 2 family protein [Bryobacteraceae bacterium]|nr:nuclear transport factor 2 family protein [Bryobacteraceae bacterium]
MKFITFLAIGVAAFAADTAETLTRADEQFCRDFAARGAEGWISWFADDAVVFRPDGPITRTRAEAAEHYRKVFPADKPNSLRWKPLGGVISASGDLGFTWGTWENNGRTGKYLTNWKKQKDGKWKVIADIGNPDAPRPPQN